MEFRQPELGKVVADQVAPEAPFSRKQIVHAYADFMRRVVFQNDRDEILRRPVGGDLDLAASPANP